MCSDQSEAPFYRLFYIPEMQLSLVRTILESPSDTGGKKTLLALATVSRLFCDSALDGIWEKIFSLRPIIKLLPESAYKEEPEVVFEEGPELFEIPRRIVRDDISIYVFHFLSKHF